MPAAAFRRLPVAGNARQKSESKLFIAPTRGWIANENLAAAQAGGAYRLENFFPTQNTIRMRGGSELFATIGEDPVTALFNYKSGATERLFAADDGNIFDVTSVADPEVAPDPEVTGQNGGDYSTAPFETAGGDFLYAVNGTDWARLYDGTRFRIVNTKSTETLAYDAKTGDFTAGLTVTGGSSGATATIIEVVDNGDGTGTLYVQDVASGPFTDNETITDSSTGSADADGANASYSTIAITGIDSAALSHANVYRSRYYFVEGGTLSAWYLPADSLGGAATEISFRGVFTKGGALLFTGTWSLDAGDGVDDKFVAVTTEGEAAVYEGSYPGGTDWSLVGRYEISPPLGKNATMRAGGDLLIATREGVVPISAAITKDPAALSLAAVSRQIEPEWKREVLARPTLPWSLLKWPSYNMAIVGLPTESEENVYCFVVNVETGAWAKYTGWDIRCLSLFGEHAYFGTGAGTIMKCEATGSDNGAPYECVSVGLFDHLGRPGLHKAIRMARSTFIASTDFRPKASVSTDYTISLPAPPAAAVDAETGNEWDVGLWDDAVWDAAGVRSVATKWNSIGRSGFVAAPQIQVTSGATLKPDVELVSMEVVFEQGALVV